MTLVKNPVVPRSASPREERETISFWRQMRFRLILGGLIIILWALIAGAVVVNAYRTAYTVFETIAEFYAVKVDAAEGALQDIARTSQATADYTALNSDTPLFEASVNDIFRNFNAYRSELFILQSNLQSDAERTAFTVADTYTYSRFWRHVSNLIDGRSDLDLARREYLSADNHLRNRIIPALEALEAENFSLMVAAGDQASTTLNSQTLMVGVSVGGFLIFLVLFSFWLRGRVRRYITPGVDGALLLTLLGLVLMMMGLFQLPEQITRMTQTAYYNISSSSRVLVAGNLANRAESSAVIDINRAGTWHAQFDASVQEMELRLCGSANCLQQPFVLSSAGQPNTPLINIAVANTASGEPLPLIASVETPAELLALEQARQSFVAYMTVHDQLVTAINAGQMDEAVALNTGFDEGSSESFYADFTEQIVNVQDANRLTFNTIWNEQRSALPTQQILYGVLIFGVVIVLTSFGVSHRFREL